MSLAGVSVVLGAIGLQQVTAQPTEPITFVVDEGLPHGITQESVEAAAEGIALGHEPFTLHVVERELEWDEYSNGETGDADIMLSIGDDPEDPDLSLHDATRVAFAGEDYGDDYSTAATIRETFVNNRTLGHGPHAIIGAALTAADLKFDPGIRTPLLWAPLAALPMFIAILVMYRWVGRRRDERARYRAFGESQLRLARAVLELETLQLRVEVAGVQQDRPQHARLQNDWKRVRELTRELARTEQSLVADLDRASPPLKARTAEQLESDLQQFAADTLDLQRRADVLAQTAEVRSGHAGSRSVLDRLALPLLQSIDEVLAHHDRYPVEARALEAHRARLLAIAQEVAAGVGTGTSPDRAHDDGAHPGAPGTSPAGRGADRHADRPADEQAAGLVSRHGDLLQRWNAVEQDIRTTALRMSRRVASPKTIPNATHVRTMNESVDERARARVSAATAGATDSFTGLRAALGLGHGADLGPLQATEQVLELIDRQAGHGQSTPPPPPSAAASGIPYGLLLGVFPLLVSLGAGFLVSSQVEDSHIQYGRTLTGDRPLAGLQVFGDPAALTGPVEPRDTDPQTHADSLDLDYVRERMAWSLEYSDEGALLPADVEVTVALLPSERYIDYAPDPEYDHRIAIDYWDLLEAQQQVKQDVAAEFPEVLDPRTGDVALGQAILPVWILEDGTYAFDNFLTGEFSVGVSSRLGAYAFTGTEPTVHGTGDMADVSIGWWISYELEDLGRAMEYNHLTVDQVSPAAVFWAVFFSAWTGILTVIMLGLAVVEAGRRRVGTAAVRRQLAGLRTDLEQLALGLDLSRLDMVAVLGLDSATGGRAEQAAQRLYESALVTAWREVDALERLPRREQRGEAWEARVSHVRRLVTTLANQQADVARRADALLRSQRFG
ncbi:FUSC family protein [Citricoccus nitrophenolicus]